MPSASAVSGLVTAERLRDGRAGDVGVQNADLVAALVHFAGKQAGDQGFAHTALAGHHADDVLDVAALVRFKLRRAAGSALAAPGNAAAAALVRAFFCHWFLLSHIAPRNAGRVTRPLRHDSTTRARARKIAPLTWHLHAAADWRRRACGCMLLYTGYSN